MTITDEGFFAFPLDNKRTARNAILFDVIGEVADVLIKVGPGLPEVETLLFLEHFNRDEVDVASTLEKLFCVRHGPPPPL